MQSSVYLTISCFFTGVFVDFVASAYSLIEPGMVEVGVELVGSLSFPVIILVEINSTVASGTNFKFCLCMYLSFYAYSNASDLDYTGESVNLTFTEAKVQFVNISILDDSLVEPDEVIQLTLTPLTSAMIISSVNSTIIEIFDNDGETFNVNQVHILYEIPNTVAEFQFSQTFYDVNEAIGMFNVCLELTSGILTEDVTIEVMVFAQGGISGCKSIN